MMKDIITAEFRVEFHELLVNDLILINNNVNSELISICVC